MRYKGPPSLQNMSALPVPRLADHLDTEIAPSDEAGGKETKRQKSEPTTPISTSSRPPDEYNEVMGITQVDSREAERFEEGLESEFHDAAKESPDIPTNVPNLGHMPCFSHGGCGSSSLQECLNLFCHAKSNSPAPCHSGVESDKPSNPPQKSVKGSVKFWASGPTQMPQHLSIEVTPQFLSSWLRFLVSCVM